MAPFASFLREPNQPAAPRAFRLPFAGLAAGAVLACAAMLPAAAAAAEQLVRFDGGIGAQPLRATGATNDVNGVPPGGRPWVISRLNAEVRTDGSIRVEGRGLVLAGGAGIGTNGGIPTVGARLFCGTLLVGDSAQVPFSPSGDFSIDGAVSRTAMTSCASPILLIVNATGAWFAAGIPKD